MKIKEKVKGCLRDFFNQEIGDDSETTLGSLGYKENQLDALEKSLQDCFDHDTIEAVWERLNEGEKISDLLDYCDSRININEFERVFNVLRDMDIELTEKRLNVCLYDIGINDGNKLVLITRLKDEFNLYEKFELDISPKDIDKKTKILDLIKHIERNIRSS